jgi:hypothetical protein
MSNNILTKHYLTITSVISIGVLSGCSYCIPLLMAMLSIPVIHLLARDFKCLDTEHNSLTFKRCSEQA